MTLEETMLEAIRAYFDPKKDTKLSPELGNTKYTMEFFDKLEEDLLGELADGNE